MQIKSSFKNRSGQTLDLIYYEGVDPTLDLDNKVLLGAHAFCFYGEKMIVVYAESKKSWALPGGGIEKGETYEQAVIREVMEETNMKVLSHELIGFVDIYEPDRIIRLTRSFCIVEPLGNFKTDPDGEITEIKLINPILIKQYFDWGAVGDHITKQALKLKRKIN